MSDSTELLALRLAMLGVIFLFVLVTAFVLRSGLKPRAWVARPRAAVQGPRLVIVAPAGTGLRPGDLFELAGDTTLGRDHENGIVLSDPSVSGRHAALKRGRDGFRIIDLGSTNGTLLNGRPVGGDRGAPLRVGDQMALGAVVIRYQA